MPADFDTSEVKQQRVRGSSITGGYFGILSTAG